MSITYDDKDSVFSQAEIPPASFDSTTNIVTNQAASNFTAQNPTTQNSDSTTTTPLLDDSGVKILSNGQYQSANYAPKLSGWNIDSDGNAEFNNGIFRGDVNVGDPSGAEVVISGNDIFLYDASIGGTNPVTGDTASLNFIRREDPTRGFILQERASIHSNDDTVLELFATANSPANAYNYIFIGRQGGDLNSTQAWVHSMSIALDFKSAESESDANGFFQIKFSDTNVAGSLPNTFFQMSDSRNLAPGTGLGGISTILSVDDGLALIVAAGAGGGANLSGIGFVNVATITRITITSNLLVVACNNSFFGGVGLTAKLDGLTTSTFLNGQIVTILTATSTLFTATFVHADVTNHADTGTATQETVSGYYQNSGNQVALGLNMIPDTDNAYNIGSASFRIKDLYVGGTIHGGGNSNPNFTATAGMAITSGFGVSIPDANGVVYEGIVPTILSDTKIDTNAVDSNYPFGSDFDWLDATHVVIVYNEEASTFKNFAVIATIDPNTSAVTFGTPLQLNTSGANFHLKVVALSSTLFVVAYNTTSTTARWVACTVSGATITQGTDVTHTIAQTPQGMGRILKVDSTHFVWGEIGPSNGGSTQVMFIPGSISGTTITLGTEVDVTLASGSNLSVVDILMCSLSTTQFAFVVGGFNGSSNAGLNQGVAFTVASNAVTAGTPTTFNGSGANFENMVVIKALDATHIVGMTSFEGYCCVASVSGTTWTSGTAAVTGTNPFLSFVQNVPGTSFDLAILSSTSFVVMSKGSNATICVAAASVSGTTITFGAGITVDSNTNIAASGAVCQVSASNPNDVVIAYQSSSNINHLALVNVTGTLCTVLWKGLNGFVSTIGYRSSKFIPFSSTSTQIGLLGSNTSAAELPYFEIVVAPPQYVGGVANGAVVAGATATINTGGVIASFSGLIPGSIYYIDPTSGGYTVTSTNNYRLGIAINSSTIIMASNPALGVAYP